MKLAIDIGNTSTTIGLFDNYNLLKKTHVLSIDESIDFFNTIKIYDVKQTIISSVVPDLTKKYDKILKDIYNWNSFVISFKHTALDTVVNEPETIGIDRLCNIKATVNLYKTPAITIDFGTATTFDVINAKGHFLGGAIATGLETSAQYLFNNAALLENTSLIFPENIIGKNTAENIQSGIMYGTIPNLLPKTFLHICLSFG